ncbi:MAG TPA: glucuronate isomerase, partial [Rhizomicrobium sp.]|nr:glucuronate isomerase [Rhizomicrobium sp.]
MPLHLHPDRFFPVDPTMRSIARELFAGVEALPIVSPHGHTDPQWFADNAPFEDATSLFLWPDHYLLRMLYSQGVSLEALGLSPQGGKAETDRRAIWRLFARLYHLFRGTPSRLWLDHAFATVFGLDVRLEEATADRYYDVIAEALATEAFRPRALFRRFNIEVLATTEGALDPLAHHARLRQDWDGRVITTFRPDDVTDADKPEFSANIEALGQMTGENTRNWDGYLKA